MPELRQSAACRRVQAEGRRGDPMTVQDAIIIPSMQHVNRLRPGDIPGIDDASSVLLALNYLIDRWNAKRLCLSGLDTFWLPLVAHQGTYTIGIPLSGPPADF